MNSHNRLAMLAALAALPCGYINAQSTNPIQAAKDALNRSKQQKAAPQTASANSPASTSGKTSANASANTTGPFTPPPGTKIDAVLLAPSMPGAAFFVSPHGIHMATLGHSGSRWAVTYDGVEGPKFDQIFGGTGSFAFSPDGSRYAYCGRQGDDVVVTVDGKEMFRSSQPMVSGAVGDASCSPMVFTSNSKHLYFANYSKFDSSHDAARFVFDGQASPPGAPGNDWRAYSFSPDGNHFAYIWGDPTNGYRQNIQKLIVDGKPAPYSGGNPQWTADSQHLYTSVRTNIPNKTVVDVSYDGKPVMRADDVRLFVPPAGDMVVALVTRVSGNIATQFLSIGGKIVPGSEHVGGVAGNGVHFSADGKHYAIRYKNPNQHEFIFWDGKKGLEYARVDSFSERGGPGQEMSFTSDGRVVYLGDDAGGSQFLVIGDQESDALRMVTELTVAQAGGHVMANSQGKVMLDGKYLPLPPASSVGHLMFSPDGAHFAFLMSQGGAVVLYRDGVAQANSGISDSLAVPFVFSPDSKHLAWICRSGGPSGGNDVGVCLDGKYFPGGGGETSNLTFSADSNHLFWNWRAGPKFRAFADGKPIVDGIAPAPSGFPKEAWEAAGTSGLILLTKDNDGFKRVSITPAPDSSIATMR